MTPETSYPNPLTNRSERVTGLILLGVLAIIFLILIIQINRRITTGHSGDFRHFYFAAGALLDHRDLYASVPMDVVERGLGRPAGAVEIAWYTTDTDRYLYPPLIALLYTPLARLRFDVAQRIILIVNAVLVYAGILLATISFIHRFSLPKSISLIGAAGLLGALLNLDKIHVELQMFQTNSLMFFMFALSLYWLQRRPILAGVPLGVILNIKYLSLAMVPWLIIRRRWAAAASCIGSTLLLALLPALISGWQTNLNNLGTAYGGLLHMVGVRGSTEQANVDDIRDYLSCSITSAMARTTHRGQSLLIPMICTASIAGAAVLAVIFLYRLNRIPVMKWPSADGQSTFPWTAVIALEFVSIVAATLCFSPQTNTRHLMLALLITIPISTLLFATSQIIPRTFLVVAGLLIAIGFIFPPGGQAPASHRLSMWWFGIGGQCWCLLIAMLFLVAVGLWSARYNVRPSSLSES